MSITVPLEGFGGGGNPLNFKIVGNPQPENPKENILWVDTDANITSWIFSATEPENLVEGMVWFSTGTASNVDFNALKKNGIMVYPLSARQYVGGAWVDKTAKSYQNGEWVDWILYLLKDGAVQGLSGGFYTVGYSSEMTISFDTAGQMTISIDGWSQGNSQGGAYSNKPIDVTPYNKMSFVIQLSQTVNGTAAGKVGITLTLDGTWTSVASTSLVNTTDEQTVEVDISSVTGEYYIQMILRGHYDGVGNTWAVKRIYLE